MNKEANWILDSGCLYNIMSLIGY